MEALTAVASKAWRIRAAEFHSCFTAVYPRFTRSVSVTGGECQLNCGHCGGRILRNMLTLREMGANDYQTVTSFLISGGCTKEGKVPITPHLAELAQLKRQRRFNLHVGLVDEADIAHIAQIADTVSFDFVGDNTTIQQVLGIGNTVEDYITCYRNLQRHCRVVPHICIGLHGGQIRGEYQALEMLQHLGVSSLTFIIFTPIRGTRFANCQPPLPAEVVKLLAKAREKFRVTPLKLGCMRPGGNYRNEIDQWAVRSGINSIVNPTPAAVRLAQSLGLRIELGEECCAL